MARIKKTKKTKKTKKKKERGFLTGLENRYSKTLFAELKFAEQKYDRAISWLQKKGYISYVNRGSSIPHMVADIEAVDFYSGKFKPYAEYRDKILSVLKEKGWTRHFSLVKKKDIWLYEKPKPQLRSKKRKKK